MRIAITGTRGVPNQYGGFEQFAEFLSVGLSELGHEVWVYNPQFHSYPEEKYKGVRIITKYFPEKLFGSAGNYFYDHSCIRDALHKKADIILECGYASAGPWYPFIRKGKTKLITHMDGMERKREKWGSFTRWLFQIAEKKAVRYSDALVCDHPEVSKYYLEQYSDKTDMIPYGADPVEVWDPGVPGRFQLAAGEYYLLVARLEPENKIRMIMEGFLASEATETLVIVGRHDGKYGNSVYREFGDNKRVRFLGGLFETELLNNLRHFSKAVFHGHSVGGTNPSLLEAMVSEALICAHDNIYNRWVLEGNALYFRSADDVSRLVRDGTGMNISRKSSINRNLARIRSDFQWKDVVRKYEELFMRMKGE